MDQDITITALNILDGMEHTAHWDGLQEAWDNEGYGFIEFCGWIADVAKMVIDDLVRFGGQDFPGVLDYEVSCELGALIRDSMLAYQMLPSEERLKDWINELMNEFFERNRE